LYLTNYWVACTNQFNQKLKLIGKGEQFTYTPTLPLTCRPPGRIRGILEWAIIILINTPARIRTRDLWLWYHIELHPPTNSTQKLKLIGKGGQFTYTPTQIIRYLCIFEVSKISMYTYMIFKSGIWTYPLFIHEETSSLWTNSCFYIGNNLYHKVQKITSSPQIFPWLSLW
jgi:hypothetical protein